MDIPLSLFTNLKPVSQRSSKRFQKNAEPFNFKIDGFGNLTTVDLKGKPFKPDADDYSSPVKDVLRLMRISQDNGFKIEWDNSVATRPHNLGENPYLAELLCECDNICDAHNRPLHFVPDPGRIEVRMRYNEERGEFVPSISLTDISEMVNPVTGELVIYKSSLRKVADIGPNWKVFSEFRSAVHADSIDIYLSVICSYFSNIDFDIEGYTLKFSDRVLPTRPTIIIESIDQANNLYMRTGELIENISARIANTPNMPRLTHVATMTGDKEITIQPISSSVDILGNAKSLTDSIRALAPDKKSGKEIFNEGNLIIVPPEVAGAFLLEGLPFLLEKYTIVGSEKLKDYQIRPVTPRLRINFTSGIDFLDGDARVEIEDTQITLDELFKQYRAHQYVTLSDGVHGVIDPRYMKRLERIFKRGRTDEGKIKLTFFDLPEIDALLNNSPDSNCEALKRPREFYTNINTLADAPAPKTRVKATLRHYQEYGVKWLKYLYDNNMGGCLADEMGLGKTLQTIALLSTIYPGEKLPTLIVMPRSLIFNWQSELKRFAPKLKVYTYYGQSRSLAEIDKAQVVLTTYALVRNDIEELRKHKFHMTVLDESQNIKNITTAISRSVLLLDTVHRFALSGTPVENNPAELYPLFRFLNPPMFGSFNDFDSRYLSAIRNDDDNDAIESLRRRIFPFMLRRLKRDVLPELPEIIEQTLYVDMDDQQTAYYEKRRLDYLNQIHGSINNVGVNKSQFAMLQALSELRRVASVPESLTDGRIHSPKLELLAERIIEAVSNGHKVVVFFNFIAGIELLGERLEAEGIDYACMTGSTNDRSRVVDRFQRSAECMVLLMTLKTGGVGLNLTAADIVFIVEPWWNRAAELQAINRLHRIGQKNTVLCYSLITRNTIEEKIRELQQRKTELFEGLISEDDLTSKKLSEEDINFILS